MLGTGALLAVAVAIAVMILPSSDTEQELTAPVPASTPAAKAEHQKKHHKQLTAAQKRTRKEAVDYMATQGYVPVRLRDWNPKHELRVLIGYRNGDAGGPRRAFFFSGGEYVGTDSTEPSSGLKIDVSGKRFVTLTYGVYASGDEACCPSGGHEKVRYEWSGTAVTPVGGTIPASWQRVASGT